ncbi:MAG: hypothetical protein HPAVJP_3280 [Candidatus Hepatoplasma vulgare]|nr:MAG: hypothetical protein HPAVJP_3280 [Candidatus Hepatoplasma sp.]
MSEIGIIATVFASIFLAIVIIESFYLIRVFVFNYYPYKVPKEELPILEKKEKEKLNQYSANQYEISYEMADVIKKLRRKHNQLENISNDLKFTNSFEIINKKLIKDLKKEIELEIEAMNSKRENIYKNSKNNFMDKNKHSLFKKNNKILDIYKDFEEDLNKYLVNIYKMEEEFKDII